MPAGCLVVIPLRSFDEPKTRLRDVLTPGERRELVVELAEAVLGALAGRPLAVVTDDPEVAEWAPAGTTILQPPVRGLNAAVTAGHRHGIAAGYRLVAIVPADLANPAALDGALDGATERDRLDVDGGHAATVTAAPDRHRDGTNLLVVPTSTPFGFAYGPRSFERHRGEAAARGLGFVELEDHDLGWDVDTPEDLERYRAGRPRPYDSRT